MSGCCDERTSKCCAPQVSPEIAQQLIEPPGVQRRQVARRGGACTALQAAAGALGSGRRRARALCSGRVFPDSLRCSWAARAPARPAALGGSAPAGARWRPTRCAGARSAAPPWWRCAALRACGRISAPWLCARRVHSAAWKGSSASCGPPRAWGSRRCRRLRRRCAARTERPCSADRARLKERRARRRLADPRQGQARQRVRRHIPCGRPQPRPQQLLQRRACAARRLNPLEREGRALLSARRPGATTTAPPWALF